MICKNWSIFKILKNNGKFLSVKFHGNCQQKSMKNKHLSALTILK